MTTGGAVPQVPDGAPTKTTAEVTVSVRWWDGYLEKFEATEARFGSDLLWMRLAEGGNRHIPLRSVRWFSLTPESHERTPPDA